MNVGNLISGSSLFSKSSLNICKFMVHVLLKPGLENFERYFTGMWDECNCAVVWAFFPLPFFGIWTKTELFQSCGHCWLFQICWYIECSTFTASSSKIWNSSAGIPSPSLALFVVQLSSVAQSCPTLWDPMDCSMPGLPVHHQLHEFSQSKKSLEWWAGFYKEDLKLGRKLSKEKRSTSSQGNQKGDGISVELFQILKDDAVKMLHSLCQQIWKTQQWPQDWKMSVFIPIPRKSKAKECSNYYSIALISHASKILLKILQVRLQQYVNQELPDVQAGFRKGRGTRDQIVNIHWIIKKASMLQNNSYFCFID